MFKQLKAYAVRKLGLHRGAPRLWLEGNLPASAGFKPQDRFAVLIERDQQKITLKLDAQGGRTVSKRVSGDSEVPVIDINSAQVLEVFAGMEQIKVTFGDGTITVEPLASEQRAQRRVQRLKDKLRAGLPLSIGSLSHGGGILSKAVHDGLASAGVAADLVFANDIRADMLEQASAANPVWSPSTIALAAPMQELAFDAQAMQLLPEVDLLEAGLPCEASSAAGRAKRAHLKEAHPESQPLVGHLAVAFLAIIAKVNPACIVLENVVPYRNTASMAIIENQLRDLGYEVSLVDVDSAEWGVLEHRKRMCMVACTKGVELDLSKLTPACSGAAPVVGDILEPVAPDAPCWSAMGYLKAKEERDKEQGKGFAMQIVTATSTKVGTIGKGYAKVRSTEPKVQHPSNPDLLRQLTPVEHARAKGIDEVLVSGLCATTAHELLGQSITPAPFKAIASLIGHALKGLVRVAVQAVQPPAAAPQVVHRSAAAPAAACVDPRQALLF